jgi:hypothetical protein
MVIWVTEVDLDSDMPVCPAQNPASRSMHANDMPPYGLRLPQIQPPPPEPGFRDLAFPIDGRGDLVSGPLGVWEIWSIAARSLRRYLLMMPPAASHLMDDDVTGRTRPVPQLDIAAGADDASPTNLWAGSA